MRTDAYKVHVMPRVYGGFPSESRMRTVRQKTRQGKLSSTPMPYGEEETMMTRNGITSSNA